jgi:ABC-type multidrug transport system ATPase subunit
MILVMDNGRIVQRGKHEELLEQGGLYKEIHDLQLSAAEEFFNDNEELEPRREIVPLEKKADQES